MWAWTGTVKTDLSGVGQTELQLQLRESALKELKLRPQWCGSDRTMTQLHGSALKELKPRSQWYGSNRTVTPAVWVCPESVKTQTSVVWVRQNCDSGCVGLAWNSDEEAEKEKDKDKLLPTSARIQALTSIILCSSEVSGTSPLQRMMTVPVVSMPRRPARPAIWMYSPASRLRMHVPSCFRTLSNTTVRAGMFTPIANVSVAKRIWGQRKSEFNNLFPGSGNVAASNADWNHPTEAGTGPSLAVSAHFNTRFLCFVCVLHPKNREYSK